MTSFVREARRDISSPHALYEDDCEYMVASSICVTFCKRKDE